MADAHMRDADAVEEDERQYRKTNEEENLEEKYPNRPHNQHKTLPFHVLFTELFNPLKENVQKPRGPPAARRGRSGAAQLSPHERRRLIIERFFSRWRKEVGDDIYPALRLILPEKDKERPMYGLKEKAIAKLLIQALRIDRHSSDAQNLLNWKLPGQQSQNTMAGDFAGRCYEVLSKRPIRTKAGGMTIADVNEKLDELAVEWKDEKQLPIFKDFYSRMNPEELMWLIRIVLRQMKIGATERTILELWHPDAEVLFNVSSSLRRVCWELVDPRITLDGGERGITLMQCFQPQLAAFQQHSLDRAIVKLRPTEEDNTFWIEEKLDGERMQLHMVEDSSIPGGRRFEFWSRKAKNYTYLYGNGLQDENSALTRHLKDAFRDGVRNLILDGEMVTWNMEQDAIVPFGTLKSAALSEQRNPFTNGDRPLFRVFDCLYLNDQPITGYTLRDRRNALASSVNPIHRRLEIHDYKIGTTVAEIETELHKVIAEASEGLVIKNPRSMYRLNDRNDDWIKVKPEYMTEYGEDLDCVIIGGYYGSGHRGGRLSSFLCGLRVNEHHIKQGADPMKCYSFFKVGGGFTANDYREIRHHTEGKWMKWDPARPPTELIELGGGDRQYERPDEWIKPSDSVVISVKGASTNTTDQFRIGLTLRFPRFRKLRLDKDWQSALSIGEFFDLKNNAEQMQKEEKKDLRIDDSRRIKRAKTLRKKPLIAAGTEDIVGTPYAGAETKVFDGLTFYIMSESTSPEKKTKAELEQMAKANGATIVQTANANEDVICVADKRLPRVASLVKDGKKNIVRPVWLFDCIEQAGIDAPLPGLLLDYEPRHMFQLLEDDQDLVESHVDDYGDSFARDVAVDELRTIINEMAEESDSSFDPTKFHGYLEEHALDLDFQQIRGWLFMNLVIYFDPDSTKSDDWTCRIVDFGGGRVSRDLEDPDVTHIVILGNQSRANEVRRNISSRTRIPHLVRLDWVMESWKESTLLDEERFGWV
jgi:DNA ligase 4